MSSEWELGSLLLEGHCFEAGTGNPTRGLQLNLGTRGKPNLTDTIVMANLGYFQLKVSHFFMSFWEKGKKDLLCKQKKPAETIIILSRSIYAVIEFLS